VIDSDRRVNIVKLARLTHPTRIVVTATETYLGHSEPETRKKPPLLPFVPGHHEYHGATRRHG
jgi:hypothetical protein